MTITRIKAKIPSTPAGFAQLATALVSTAAPANLDPIFSYIQTIFDAGHHGWAVILARDVVCKIGKSVARNASFVSLANSPFGRLVIHTVMPGIIDPPRLSAAELATRPELLNF
jgi:hypothetical protein